MPSALNVDRQFLSIDDVKSIVISDIVADEAGLVYVRLVQIYVDPISDTTRRPVLELTLRGGDQTTGDKTALEITTPPLPY